MWLHLSTNLLPWDRRPFFICFNVNYSRDWEYWSPGHFLWHQPFRGEKLQESHVPWVASPAGPLVNDVYPCQLIDVSGSPFTRNNGIVCALLVGLVPLAVRFHPPPPKILSLLLLCRSDRSNWANQYLFAWQQQKPLSLGFPVATMAEGVSCWATGCVPKERKVTLSSSADYCWCCKRYRGGTGRPRKKYRGRESRSFPLMSSRSPYVGSSNLPTCFLYSPPFQKKVAPNWNQLILINWLYVSHSWYSEILSCTGDHYYPCSPAGLYLYKSRKERILLPFVQVLVSDFRSVVKEISPAVGAPGLHPLVQPTGWWRRDLQQIISVWLEKKGGRKGLQDYRPLRLLIQSNW